MWSVRRCSEACCCVLFLGLQFFGLLQSFPLQVCIFSGCCKVSRCEFVLFRATTKSLVDCCNFSAVWFCSFFRATAKSLLCVWTISLGLLQSFSLCSRSSFSWTTAKFLVICVCLFSGCSMQIIRICFFSGCCNFFSLSLCWRAFNRAATKRVPGLLQSSLLRMRTAAKFLEVYT